MMVAPNNLYNRFGDMTTRVTTLEGRVGSIQTGLATLSTQVQDIPLMKTQIAALQTGSPGPAPTPSPASSPGTTTPSVTYILDSTTRGLEIAAAAAATDGSRNSKALQAIADSLGAGITVKTIRNILATDTTISIWTSASKLINNGDYLSLPAMSHTSTAAGDIDTGTWRMEIYKTSDATRKITIPMGATSTLTAMLHQSDDTTGGVAALLGDIRIYLAAPGYDPAIATATAYRIQSVINQMSLPNPSGYYPKHGIVSGHGAWGADENGHSYAYVALPIRNTDTGPDGQVSQYLRQAGQPPVQLRNPPYGGPVNNTTDIIRQFPWFGFADSYQRPNISPNTRVQIRKMKRWQYNINGIILPVNDLEDWTAAVAGGGAGSFFNNWLGGVTTGQPGADSLAPNTNPAACDSFRIESAGNGGGVSLGQMGYGTAPSPHTSSDPNYPLLKYNSYIWHGYPLAGFDGSGAQGLDYQLSQWEQNIRGTLISLETRLILNDVNGTDDRNNSTILGIVAADWYNMSANGRYILEAYHSAFTPITNDWQVLFASDLSPTVLRNTLPNGFTL